MPQPRHSTRRLSARRLSAVIGVLAAAAAVAVFAPMAAGAVSEAPVTASAAVDTDPSEVFPGGFYLEPGTEAEQAADRLRAQRKTESAQLIDQIASQPTAIWLGEWDRNDQLVRKLKNAVAGAKKSGTTAVFVTYAIPNRDCGGYSAGGHDYDDYLNWNRLIGDTLKGSGSVILVEPDSLSMLLSAKCGDEATRRLPMISKAVDILVGRGSTVYLDGGNSRWHEPKIQAGLLKKANITKAYGFYTNVSNFNRVQEERDYAGKLSARVGWKHFVIDVSRSGNGWTGDWCNPDGAALGQNPTVTRGTGKLDALLWVKHPGISDGTCHGGPPAGDWYESYALDLARNR